MRSLFEAAFRLFNQVTIRQGPDPLSVDTPGEHERGGPLHLLPDPKRAVIDVDEILAMYARGMTAREIQAFLATRDYPSGAADFVSGTTTPDTEAFTRWQSRRLEPMYPIAVFDALGIKTWDAATVENRDVYFALAVLPNGTRDILGLWVKHSQGTKFWIEIFEELKARGCRDILIAITDEVDGVREAMAATYPATTLQTQIIHLIRHTLRHAHGKDRTRLAQAVRPIYAAINARAAAAALEAFECGPCGSQFPAVVTSWRSAWPKVVAFFGLPLEIRRVIYTTNALESVHVHLRRRLKTYGPFLNDHAAKRLIWLLLYNIAVKWRPMVPNWRGAMTQFALRYDSRFAKPRV